MQENESRDGRDQADYALSILGAGVIDEPVALKSQLSERLALEVVPILQISPLRFGDHGRDHRHRLVLFAFQVGQQHVREASECRHQALAAAVAIY
jgi:hypothetical protein